MLLEMPWVTVRRILVCSAWNRRFNSRSATIDGTIKDTWPTCCVRGRSGLTQVQLVVLVRRVGAEEATPPLRVLVSDSEAQHPGVKVPHLQKIVANNTYMSEIGDQSHTLSSL